MNKTLLLFIVDFLFLNLIALTRWERAEPARPRQPPVNEISANTVSKDQDLVEAMRQSLTDEQLSRQALEQKLASADSTLLVEGAHQLAEQLQSDSLKLTAQLVDTQKSQADLNRKYQAQSQEDSLTRSQLAQLEARAGGQEGRGRAPEGGACRAREAEGRRTEPGAGPDGRNVGPREHEGG